MSVAGRNHVVLLALLCVSAEATLDLSHMQVPEVHVDYEVGRDGRALQDKQGISITALFSQHGQCTPGGCFCQNVGEVIDDFLGRRSYVCEAQDILTTEKSNYMREIMSEAREWLSKALLISPTGSGLIPTVGVCGTVTDATRGIVQTAPGVSGADFVIHVTAVPAEGSTQAWALFCSSDQNGRPTVGQINFSPHLLQPSAKVDHPVEHTNSVNTAIHELMHALGFSKTFFANQNRRWFPSINRMPALTVLNGKEMINTPKVLEKAREHFGCPTMQGVALEDQGEQGTQGNHWEKRLMGNEAMTGAQTSELTVISAITLAYFEDTGMYGVNYSMAGGLRWGKGQGCSFVSDTCLAYDKNRPTQAPGPTPRTQEFCFPASLVLQDLQQQCTTSRRAYGSCNIHNYTNGVLPAVWRYFSPHDEMGGGVKYSDYCPFYAAERQCTSVDAAANLCKGYTSEAICNQNRVCYYDVDHCVSKELDVKGNTFSPTSRCFNAHTSLRYLTIDDLNARCFPVTCSPDRTSYFAEVGHTKVYCNATLEHAIPSVEYVAKYKGVIPCLAPEVMCDDAELPTAEFTIPVVTPVATEVAPKEDEDDNKLLMIIVISAAAGLGVLALVCFMVSSYCTSPDPPKKQHATGYTGHVAKQQQPAPRTGMQGHKKPPQLVSPPPHALPGYQPPVVSPTGSAVPYPAHGQQGYRVSPTPNFGASVTAGDTSNNAMEMTNRSEVLGASLGAGSAVPAGVSPTTHNHYGQPLLPNQAVC